MDNQLQFAGFSESRIWGTSSRRSLGIGHQLENFLLIPQDPEQLFFFSSGKPLQAPLTEFAPITFVIPQQL